MKMDVCTDCGASLSGPIDDASPAPDRWYAGGFLFEVSNIGDRVTVTWNMNYTGSCIGPREAREAAAALLAHADHVAQERHKEGKPCEKKRAEC